MLARSSVLALVATSLVAALGACSSQDPVAGDDSDLVGGSEASATDFPSTLLVRGNCTVARVGPRHILTAAHCVFDENGQAIRGEFGPGSKIFVTDKRAADSYGDPAASGFREVTLKKVHVPGIYYEEREYSVRVLSAEAAPDVAIMEVTEDSEAALANIPIASVDLAPVAAGSSVAIMGYGCEAGVDGPKDYSKQRLKFQRTTTLGIDSQDHEGGWVKDRGDEYRRRLEKQYIFTPGQGGKTEEASLCPGDSGGPVYRLGKGEPTIIGVNAYYSFRPVTIDGARISVSNWHTRLDGDSRFDTGSWLASLGVQVAGGKANDAHYGDCKASAKTGRLLCGDFAKRSIEKGGESKFGAPTKEARLEAGADGSWRWTQVFEGKELTLTSSGVSERVLMPEGACAGKQRGHYCGNNFGDADSRALYRCESGAVGERIVCEHGCQAMPSGVPDKCSDGAPDPCAKANAGDGRYCGQSLGASSATLYQCKAKATFAAIPCANGCESMPRGVPDRCRP